MRYRGVMSRLEGCMSGVGVVGVEDVVRGKL